MVRGGTFWARGYCVSTVGLDEETIREYIRNQEKEDKGQLQLTLKIVNGVERSDIPVTIVLN